MKIRWRAAKGTYYLVSESMQSIDTTKEFKSDESFNIPVFRAENREFVVLQYRDADEWKDVEYGEDGK